VRREIRRQGIAPAEEIVTDEDPAAMSLWQAVRYVLRVRTNIILILSSSLGYFFFAGLRTFAVIFLRGQYGLGEASASLVLIAVGAGALVGVVVAGDVGDRIVRRGRIDGRLVVGTVGFVAAAVTLVPALLSPLLYVSLPLFLLAAACVAAPNPALDAARLDVMPARMWGRAEGVRTVLRQSMEAFAPLLFGIVSQLLGGGHVGLAAGVAAKHAVVTARETRGLQLTFLLMLVPLIGAGVVLVGARHSYPVDVASAGESDHRVREREDA
jgi:sugar phosphate permease